MRRLVFFALCLAATAAAQSWTARYNGTAGGADMATAMVADPAGNIYVTGYSAGSSTALDYATVKYLPNGDTGWVRRYTSAGANDDIAVAIAYSQSGFVSVAGLTGGSNSDITIIKYDAATGTAAAPMTYANAGRDSATGVAFDGTGNVYVSGYLRQSGHTEAAVVKYSGAGTFQWQKRVTLPVTFDTTSVATAIRIDAGGNPCICGFIKRLNGKDDYLVARLNSATGDTFWVRRYNGPRDSTDVAYALAADGAGNLYITGASWDATQFDYATLKYNSTGVQQWVSRYTGPGNDFDEAHAIAVDGPGNVYVTGFSTGSGNNDEDYLTVKYNSLGAQRWTARYNGTGGFRVDNARAIAVDAGGYVYVTGFSEGSGNNAEDVLTIRYDSTGSAVWTSRYDYADDVDEGIGLALLPDGSIAAAGSSFGTTGYDYLTLKYIDHDLGIVSWLEPTGVQPPQPVVPKVRVYNYGAFEEQAQVYVWIHLGNRPVYSDMQLTDTVAPGADHDVWFVPFYGDTGVYTVRCSVALAGDLNHGNDTLSASFTFRWSTVPYWLQRQNVPAGPSFKPVKDGACLTYGRYEQSSSAVYCLKGNNTNEFYRCYVNNTPPADTWHLLDSLPYDTLRSKRVKKGAALCYDRYDTTVYALKGNNTQEFWKFDVYLDTWVRRQDVPLGLSNKRVKGGSALAFYHSTTYGDQVLALKGNKTDELWSYQIATDSWVAKKGLPLGLRLKGAPDGSCMVNAGGVFYVLKGGYNEFYAYYPAGDSWVEKESLPMYGKSERKRKAKNGTGLCYGNGAIYCIKGGSTEFWAYYPEANVWAEVESMPRFPSLKTVKNGGALTFGNGYVWALKGNKTSEFWSYSPGTDLDGVPPVSGQNGPTVKETGLLAAGAVRVVPNPVRGTASVIFSAPLPSRSALTLFSADGRLVRRLSLSAFTRSAVLERAGLQAGVYLLRLESQGLRLTTKVVFE